MEEYYNLNASLPEPTINECSLRAKSGNQKYSPAYSIEGDIIIAFIYKRDR